MKSLPSLPGSEVAEDVPEVVYHRVDLPPMPVIDYDEHTGRDTGGDATVRERASLTRASSPRASSTLASSTCDERDLFIEVPAGEGLPVPRELFGSMWYEGELAVLLGAPGTGKSLLAVQIADALARGKPPGGDATVRKRAKARANGFDRTTTRSAPVLYFDLVLDQRQWTMRYSPDARPGDERLRKPHRFSSRFHRLQIDLTAEMPGSARRMQDLVLRQIEKAIVRTGARVAVIDTIDRFNFGVMRNGDLGYVMSALLGMKRRLGISLLVVAAAHRPRPGHPLTADRLLATRTICSFADSVFSVGECRWQDGWRYVKHLSSRSSAIVCDASHVPTFSIGREKRNFLSFEFDGFYPESLHLDARMDHHRLQRIRQCKQLAAEGLTQRQIAGRMKMSLTAVSRAIHRRSALEDGETGCRHPKNVENPEQTPLYAGPAAVRTPEEIERDRQRYARDTRRYLLDSGILPSTTEENAVIKEKEQDTAAEPPDRPQQTANDLRSATGIPLKHSYDSIGNDIWIESESDGKPMIWYSVGKQGHVHRSERKFDIIFQSVVKQIGSPELRNKG